MTDEFSFSHKDQPTIGILITNLGTPDAPTPAALRRYLREFLWDPRIVDMPRPLWWMILQVILLIRPKRSAHAYEKVWTERGSPLMDISKRQLQAVTDKLQTELNQPVVVELGMRYGQPSIAHALNRLRKAHAQQVLVLPLYPQYSSSTTASTFDAVAAAVKRWRWVPELRFINSYHDNNHYIAALAASIREAWQQRPASDMLVFSFHGTPRRFLMTGDPYYCQCQATARLVAEQLQLEDGKWQVTFQSIFGREQWLQPYTIDTLRELPGKGVKSVDIICPGFSADCLETLEEIEVENRDAFLAAGGEAYHYIPALNDRPDHIAALTQLVGQHLQGWLEQVPADAATREQINQQRWQRAQSLGAES
jgi:ferrochelatase